MAPGIGETGEVDVFTVVSSKRRHRSSEKRRSKYIISPTTKTTKHIPSHIEPKKRDSLTGAPSSSDVTVSQPTAAASPAKKKSRESSTSNPKHTAFTRQAAEEDVLLEALITEYFIKQTIPQLFCSHSKGSVRALLERAQFFHKHGDPFTFLNITRKWVQHLAKGDSREWCSDRYMDETVLKDMEKSVTKSQSELGLPRNLKLNEDYANTDSKLLLIFLTHFRDGLCVYRGHPSLGYWSVSKWRSLHLDQSSALSQLGSFSKYILVLQDTSDAEFIHTGIVLDDVTGASVLANFPAAKEMLKTMTVTAVSILNVGEVVSKHLAERMKNGSLRKHILDNCEWGNLIITSPDDKVYNRNDFTIFVSQTDQDIVHAKLQETVLDIVRQVKEDFFELPYPNNESHVRALTSAGGNVQQILLPHQYRTILIQQTQTSSLSKDEVMKTLSIFGEIERIIQYDQSEDRNDGKWGVVVFKDPKSVQMTLAAHTTLDNMLVELTSLRAIKEIPLIEVHQSVQVVVRICRRPFENGKASVKFRATRDYSRATDAGSFYVKNVQVSGLKPDGKGGFLIRGLHKSTIEKDIVHGLKTIGLKPDEVSIHRKPPFKCTVTEMERFKSGLKKILDKVTDLRKVNIVVTKVQNEDIDLAAKIVFANQRTAMSATDSLLTTRFQDKRLKVDVQESDNTVKVLIQNELLWLLQTEIQRFIRFSHRKLAVDVSIHTSPTVEELHIVHHSPHKVESVLAELQEILKPTTVTVNKRWYNKLTRGHGRYLLNAVRAQSNTLIKWNDKSLEFYGPVNDRSKAVTLLRGYMAERQTWFQFNLADLSDNTSTVCQCVENLSKLYGVHLSKLKHECDITDFVFDNNTKSLLFSSINTDARTLLLQAIIKLYPDIKNNLNRIEGLPECCACFCEPDSRDDIYYMAACGHAYCIGCARDHVLHATDGRKFPVECAMDNCGQSVSNDDLIILSDIAFKDGHQYFTKLTLDTYVLLHRDDWCYCHQPYCSGLVQKEDIFPFYTCGNCMSRSCKKCFQQFHSGSCEDFHNHKALAQWFGSDAANRKRCPKCKMGIEKVDGCNRIGCAACKQHICWVCLAYYANMQECYDHLNKEHGGY